jgi:flagellar biosynthetic protein FliO
MNGSLAVLLVLGLVGALAWVVRRGGLGALARKGGAIAVETAVALGERRSLVIVSVEGRRLLLGLTPTHMSLVTELGAGFDTALGAGCDTAPGAGFDTALGAGCDTAPGAGFDTRLDGARARRAGIASDARRDTGVGSTGGSTSGGRS